MADCASNGRLASAPFILTTRKIFQNITFSINSNRLKLPLLDFLKLFYLYSNKIHNVNKQLYFKRIKN